jgi:hypothetical protein
MKPDFLGMVNNVGQCVQMRQGGMLVEKLAENFKTSKVCIRCPVQQLSFFV